MTAVGRALLLLELGERSCVLDSNDVRRIGAASLAGDLDFDALLGVEGGEADQHTLEVSLDEEPRRCQTRATLLPLELPRARLFALPRVIRRAGCAPFVRGVAVLDAARLVLWIDIKAIFGGGVYGARA